MRAACYSRFGQVSPPLLSLLSSCLALRRFLHGKIVVGKDRGNCACVKKRQGIICAHKSGSSVHTGFPHLLRHALWIICAHKVSVIWLICTHTHTFGRVGGWGGGRLVSTPAQARPLSTVGGGGWWGGGGNGKHTRSPRMRKSSPKGWGVGGEAGEW